MNKKLISALLSVVTAAGGIGVFAAENNAGEISPAPAEQAAEEPWIGASMSGTDMVIDDVEGGSVVITGYDDDGRLVYAKGYDVSEDKTVTLPGDILGYELKMYNISTGEILEVHISGGDPSAPTAAPSATETPAPTATPDPSATEAPEETPEPDETPKPQETYNPNVFPEVYGEASVAVNAFAVVEKVSSSVQDSEQGFTIEYLCQGSENSVWLDRDVLIVSAPDSQNGVIGSDVSALKRGDVVYLNRAFGGEIKEVALLYRPLSSDIVNSSEDYGTNFEELFSVNGTAVGGYSGWGVASYGSEIPSSGTYFAFGVSARRDGGTLYLLNKSGDANGAIELSLPEDVVAYRCDMTDTIGIDSIRMSQITSSIPTSTWEDAYGSDDSVIELDDTDYDYVLARVVDGTVMDIILYTY